MIVTLLLNSTLNLILLTFVKAKMLNFLGRAARVWEQSFLEVPPRCAPDVGSEATRPHVCET